MSLIFADHADCCIVIYDNILLLAHNYADAFEKLDLFLQRCIDRNITMKFAKSWLGFDSVKFFGYLCKKGSYELTEERKAELTKIPFPTTMKQMQSFLGFALFFDSRASFPISPFLQPHSTKWFTKISTGTLLRGKLIILPHSTL